MSKIPFSQLQTGLASYIEAEIIPKIPPQTVYPLGNWLPISLNSTLLQFAGGMGIGLVSQKIADAMPMLQRLGVVDETGLVDIDMLGEMMATQMQRVGGKLPVGPFTFAPEDINHIKSYVAGSAVQI